MEEIHSKCNETVTQFIGEVKDRASFDIIEKRFSDPGILDKNPVFKGLKEKGAFIGNIIIVLGGRGCGKTLTLRYMKYYFGKRGWDFRYLNGADKDFLDYLKKTVDDVRNKMNGNEDYKVALAIDDVAEIDELARDYLKDTVVPLIHNFAGRIKLILAAQSERVTQEGITTLTLLQIVLGKAKNAEMFFGENPEENITKAFKESYIRKADVWHFRAAVIINLDAYWSCLRSLDKIEELANIIVELAEFYVLSAEPKCSEIVNEIKRFKEGLALISLATLPKLADPKEKIIIEYSNVVYAELDNPLTGLNGSNIAELIRLYFIQPYIRNLASKMQIIYEKIIKSKAVNIGPEDVKKAILEALQGEKLFPYISVLESAAVDILPFTKLLRERTEKSGKKKRGPKIDLIKIIRQGSGIKREKLYLVVHDLKTYATTSKSEKKRYAYIPTRSLKKIKELIELKVAEKQSNKYLFILAPSRKYIPNVLRYIALSSVNTGVNPLDFVGESIFILLTDTLSDRDKTLINMIINGASSQDLDGDKEVKRLLYKIIIGTVLFNLRDYSGEPQLTYYILPLIKPNLFQ